jgi:putative membrane protein
MAAAPEGDPPRLRVVPGAAPVDLRILQANERTLLAWIRTGLAVMAFGFVVGRIGAWLPGEEGGDAWPALAGAAFVVLGTAANTLATLRYVRVRRAILEGEPVIPGNATVLSLAIGLVLLGAILAVYLLVV